MLSQRSQNPFWIYKFSSNDSVWCQKYHLHCTISWRPRTAFLKHFESKCMSIYIYVRKFLFQRRSKILSGCSGGGGGGRVWRRLNSFFKAARCLGLVKCLTILEIQQFFNIAILPSIVLKRWNFPDNLYFKGKIVVKLLIKSHLNNLTTK